MATYKNINGSKVQSLASDPPAPYEGQVWYNSTSNTLKGYTNSPSVWSSGNSMNVARFAGSAAGTSQTAGLVWSGRNDPSGGTYLTATESYNGSWTNQPAMPLSRTRAAGTGTSTLAVSAGGTQGPPTNSNSGQVFNYNGSWTANGTQPKAQVGQGAVGPQTASFFIGGQEPPYTAGQTGHFYDGSSWTTAPGTTVNPHYAAGTTGSQTSALIFGGQIQPSPGASAQTELYNGTAWTVVNSLGATRYEQTYAGNGTATSAISAGGTQRPLSPNYTNSVETWNGTVWTSASSMAIIRNQGDGFGSSGASMVAAGGYTSWNVGYNTVELFSGGVGTVTFTTS